jgi:hypothetical protein
MALTVNSKLKIVNCVATPSKVVIYFSAPLDTRQGQSDPASPGNYTLQLPANGVSNQYQGSFTATYDAFNNATVLQLANPLTPGQWVTVGVTNVTSVSAGSIMSGGNDTFSVRVDGGDEPDGHVRKITESVEDAVAYPLLTEQVSFPSAGGTAPSTAVAVSAAGGGVALGQIAAKAVSDVLGWKANAADPKGFIGSLTQAFALTTVEGHVEARWNPRTYAVQTDLGGGISGAQASLYTRATDALNQSLPLLDGLYPLDPDADPEYVKALREMARSQMNEIVKEFGTLGGPSILRVNTYFHILLGSPQHIQFQPPTRPEFDPDKIKGTLGTLRDTYGIYFLDNPFSNSMEDERDVTNFRVISDYMTSLLQTWISNGQFFELGSTSPNFFGTQLVLLSRQYSVIAETVNEVRFALDSVFIGPAERQTLLLEFTNDQFPAIFIEDLLREIEDHATDEGPRLLQDGGRISVANNILPIMRNLMEMVGQAHRPRNLKSLPDGYRTVRVQRALDDLHDQLKELIRLAVTVEQRVPAPLEGPEVANALFVSPNPVSKALTPTVTIAGTGFLRGVHVSFSGGVGRVPTTFVSANFVVAGLGNVPAGNTPYTVTVTNPDRTQSVVPGGLTVSA